MNKKDSLAFLDECLEKLDSATDKDIAKYKAVYKKNCSNYLLSDDFVFCAPKVHSSVYETDYLKYATIETDYIAEMKKKTNNFFEKEQVNSADNSFACAA